MAQFLTERSGTQFTAYRPPNYGGWWFITLVAASALAIIYMKLDSIKEHLNRDTIGYICVVASLIFTSGQMWNSIRGPQERLATTIWPRQPVYKKQALRQVFLLKI